MFEFARKMKKTKKIKNILFHHSFIIIALSTSSLDTLTATALAVATQSSALRCPSIGVGCSSSFQYVRANEAGGKEETEAAFQRGRCPKPRSSSSSVAPFSDDVEASVRSSVLLLLLIWSLGST